MIRGVAFLRAVAPLPVVAPETVGKAHAVVLQKVGGAPPAGVAECRFRHHGVAFQKGGTGIQGRHCSCPELAGQDVEDAESFTCLAELHLCDMPSFMDGELGDPGSRFRVDGFGCCV